MPNSVNLSGATTELTLGDTGNTDNDGFGISFVHNRCRIAIDEIYDMEVARMTADPAITSIPADKDAVVLAADIQSAAERNAAAESDLPE